MRRLRERSQPILLFGESELDAHKRLRKLEIDEPDFKPVRLLCFLVSRLKMITCTQGARNDFQAALNAVEQDYLKEVIEGASSSRKPEESVNKHDVKVIGGADTVEDFETLKKRGEEELPKGNYVENCGIILSLLTVSWVV